MKTILTDNAVKLELDDSGFEKGFNGITITLATNNNSQRLSISIPLKDIMGALIGFDAKNSRLDTEHNS